MYELSKYYFQDSQIQHVIQLNIMLLHQSEIIEQIINLHMYNQDGEQQESLHQFENSLDSLIIRLQHEWSLRNIDKGYKNTIMIYLNQLDPNQAKKYILKQQKKLEQNNCRGQFIQQMRVERQQILLKLYQTLDSQQNINEACLSLDELRKINLRICQSIIDFKQQLDGFEQGLFALSEGYGQFLRRFNKDNAPIINSYLKQYICFTKNYDPFLLFPYQKFQIEGFPQNIHEVVVKLFKMNISYVYRLIKARKQINTFLQIKKTQQISLEIQNKTFQEVDQEQENQQPIQKKFKKYKYTGIRRNKFQTIGYEQNNQQQEDYNERFSKSLPQSQSKTIQTDYSKASKIKRFKKFKLRQITQPEKKSLIRQKPQNFQVAEDEDINIFRKKMLARKQKRRIINLKQIQQDSQQNEDYSIKPIKKLSLDLNRKGKYFTEGNLQTPRKKQIDSQQVSQSSSSEEVMEPRNIQVSQARFTKNLKLNLNNRNIFKRPVKKQRIKLSPLTQLKSSERQDQSTRFYPNKLNLDFQNQLAQHKNKKQYYPLSPVIKQMIKQSSQSSDEISNNKKKQAMYQSIKKDNNQELPQIKSQFRIKKIPINQVIKPEDQSQRLYKSYVQNTSLKINDQTNDKNFRDIHIRRPHESQSQNQIIQNQYDMRNNNMNLTITKNFEKSHFRFQTAKNQKQSFSRLSSRNKDHKQQKVEQKQTNNSQVKNQFTPIINVKKKVQQKILNQIQKELQQSKQKKKQIQMKPGQIKLPDLYTFIEKQKVNPFQRQEFEVGLWKQNINLKHSYLTKFYMNSELAAFGISSPRCDGDYNILYWATTCSDSFTTFLFGKYVDYLQKFTTLSKIYINSPAYSYAEFQKKGSIYIRKRKNFQKRQLPYIPFLSLQCSNICFQQSKSSQISIFYSEQIQEFSIQNSKTNTIIALCDSNNVSKINLPSKAKIYEQKLSIAQINNILDGLQIDSYAISQKIQVNQCKIFALKDNSSIKNNYFYVRDGFFVPKGIEIYNKQKQKIMRLQMMTEDYYLFFGKNFQTIQSFLTNTRTKPNGQERFFGFKMFSKQLYGRIKNSQFLHKGCYGNWDINFLWQDQLKGTVIKQMPSSDYMFGPDSFYVAIYKSDSLLFSFEVQSSDFFF